MQDIPSQCTVLVVGGGPGGSFTASALAREGIDTVLLEAASFPRYHVGESMLPSLRHFLRFIDLDNVFKEHGFYRKNGAAFKLNQEKREGCNVFPTHLETPLELINRPKDTNFLSAGGPESYTWNVIRSESDELMFRHASKSGAKIFDGVKVTSINFSSRGNAPTTTPNVRSERPVSASYQRKSDGKQGQIIFDYIVDASGRAGILHTKYLKNRTYSKSLKNLAYWGYWTGTASYGLGTERANSPFFEALKDESGWAWLIPLHNGTTSVGVVMNQDIAMSQRQAAGTQEGYQCLQDFYLSSLRLAPNLLQLLEGGKLVTDVNSASDYSYSSSSYAIPYARTVGDAGCFIDPFFSSGVHLALTGGVSAAATICAAIRGNCTEEVAAKWHSSKVEEAYSRFLVVVFSAYRQMQRQDEHILSAMQEDNFDKAFNHLRPIIQGTVDVSSKLSQEELRQSLDFCAAAFDETQAEEKEQVMEKLKSNGKNVMDEMLNTSRAERQNSFCSEEELRVIGNIRARHVIDVKSSMSFDNFGADVIDGMRVNLQPGKLGLVSVST